MELSVWFEGTASLTGDPQQLLTERRLLICALSHFSSMLVQNTEGTAEAT